MPIFGGNVIMMVYIPICAFEGTMAKEKFPRVTLRKMHRPPQARSRYLPHAAVRKSPKYGD